MGKYQRNHTTEKGQHFRGQDIEKKICPNCRHDRMWVARGENPSYQYKCAKCGYKIKPNID